MERRGGSENDRDTQRQINAQMDRETGGQRWRETERHIVCFCLSECECLSVSVSVSVSVLSVFLSRRVSVHLSTYLSVHWIDPQG